MDGSYLDEVQITLIRQLARTHTYAMPPHTFDAPCSSDGDYTTLR